MAEEVEGNPLVAVERESSYSFKINGQVAAQLIFTAGFAWPELRLYNPATGRTDVVSTAPNVLVAIGAVLQTRMEMTHPSMPDVPVALACPDCGSKNVKVINEEQYECNVCHCISDTYEFVKAADRPGPAKPEGA